MDGREQGCRMQNLCAEIGELSSLIEADALDRSSVRTEPWIGRHHTFDIGPDLDAIRFQHRTNDGSRVVGTATAEGSRYAGFSSCDESAEHGDSLLGNEWHNFLVAALSRLFH